MIDFKSFLKINEQWSLDKDDDMITVFHNKIVKGNHVQVAFEKMMNERGKPTDEWDVTFHVNDSLSKPNTLNQKAHHIIKHVKNVIHEFVKNNNPKKLHFSSFDNDKRIKTKKENLYKHMAKGYPLIKDVENRNEGLYGYNGYSIKLKESIDENWTSGSFDSIPDSKYVHHHDKVDEHRIDVAFWNIDHDTKPGHYTMSFKVNHKESISNNLTPHVTRKILNHVTNVTREFVNKHKPKTITIEGSGDSERSSFKKQKIYNHLMKKHNVNFEDKGKYAIARINEEIKKYVNELLL